MGAERLKLPIGIQSFEVMRSQGFLYVDKTPHIHRLVTEGMYYFLSRPRRFGKSLLVSTLKCLFQGQRDLFDGLWIAETGRWNWQPHPVIALDMSLLPSPSAEKLEQSIAFAGKINAVAGEGRARLHIAPGKPHHGDPWYHETWVSDLALDFLDEVLKQ